MVPRYDIPEISNIWSDESKFSFFMKVELALLKTLETQGIVPKVSQHYSAVKISPSRIQEIERTVHHDVIAFCSSITEQVPSEAGKFFHFGCTSSDIIDTALSLQIRECLNLEIKALKDLRDSLWKKALESKNLFTMGRSHGMFAEPMSFGFKFLSYVAEFSRRLEDIQNYERSLTGQMSGAVGNYTILSPEIEEAVLSSLGLKVEPLSTQVIPRDRLATLASLQSGIADALERLAVEIRHLHRSDVSEVVEGFRPGQKGSSTMPHKKNPIASENITGIARVIRSHEIIAHENTALWHERDISHSSAERMWLPDSFGLTIYALRRANKMIQDLHLNREEIAQKVEEAHTSASSYVLHKLLPHFPGTREELYALIQAAAFEAKDKAGFQNLLREKLSPFKINPDTLCSVNSLDHMYGPQIEAIYGRIQKNYGLKNELEKSS